MKEINPKEINGYVREMRKRAIIDYGIKHGMVVQLLYDFALLSVSQC